MSIGLHRSVSIPPQPYQITILPPPIFTKPENLTPWQEKLWTDLSKANQLNISSEWAKDPYKSARNKHRQLVTDYPKVTSSQVEEFFRDLLSRLRPIQIYSEATTKLYEIGQQQLKLPESSRSIRPIQVTYNNANTIVSIAFDPEMERIIGTHPKIARAFLKTIQLGCITRKDLEPACTIIKKQVDAWLDSIPADQPTAIKSDPPKRVTPPPTPISKARNATNQRYFQALYLIAIAIALIAFIITQPSIASPKSLSAPQFHPPEVRQQVVSPYPIQPHGDVSADRNSIKVMNMLYNLIEGLSPEVRQTRLFHALLGKKTRAEHIPAVIRAFILEYAGLESDQNPSCLNDLKELEAVINRFKTPDIYPNMDIQMTRLLFFSEPERLMNIADWDIPNSKTIIARGSRRFEELDIVCVGEFSMTSSDTSTTAEQISVLFTGYLNYDDKTEQVKNMPCWISNTLAPLANHHKKV